MPIKSPTGRTIAALNSSTLSARHTPDDLVRDFLPELLKASVELAEMIGW